MRALILIAGAALALSACVSDEPSSPPSDGNTVTPSPRPRPLPCRPDRVQALLPVDCPEPELEAVPVEGEPIENAG